MTISWTSNEIRDLLIVDGIPSAAATKYQSLLQDIATLNAAPSKTIVKDSTTDYSTQVSAFELVTNSSQAIMKLYAALYPNSGGLSDATVTTWIIANYPEYTGQATPLGLIITHLLDIVDDYAAATGSSDSGGTETIKHKSVRKAQRALSVCAVIARRYANLPIGVITNT